jgi:glycosyltransferase involved in cell wall biosynthesis
MKSLVESDANLKGVISFPGMLSGDSKWGAFYNCEAFVLPSHQENFGIAVVEALACGKPVLISNQVNIWREIENAGAGFVEDDTIEGTEKLLNRWSTLSEDEKRSMGRKARALYLSNFAVKTAAENLRNAIKR